MRFLNGFVLLLFAAVFASCASLPPQRPVASLNELAGTWTAINAQSMPVKLVMQRDGSFEAVITLPSGGTVTRRGVARMEGGEVRYDADLSTGTITVHEDGKRRMFVLHGTMKPNTDSPGSKFDTEYTNVGR